ncbi:MAG TPA: hypothetical protein P5287_07845 [bacterium]|nr:hypothetical protein [bacterium]
MRTRKNCFAIACLAVLALFLLAAPSPRASEQKHRQFDYRTCTVQFDRVTFVNGVWVGKVQPAEGNTQNAVLSCPLVHEYLQTAGNDGWELVSCYSKRAGINQNASDDTTQTLFLKKDK